MTAVHGFTPASDLCPVQWIGYYDSYVFFFFFFDPYFLKEESGHAVTFPGHSGCHQWRIADVNSMLIIYQLYFLINWHLLDLIIITAIFNALERRGIKMPGRILDLRLSMVSTHKGDLTFKGTLITYSKVLWEYPIKTKIGYRIIDCLLFSK